MTFSADVFRTLRETAAAHGPDALLDALADVLEKEKQYPQLFEALLMKKRRQLGLPLQSSDNLRSLPEEAQLEVENYYIEVCRKVGGLFLKDGNIQSAWPYFRAIDEPKPVADALDAWNPPPEDDESDSGEETDALLDIALTQGANPRRGFELMLSQYGVCRSITTFEHQFPFDGKVKQECCKLLLQRLYDDLFDNLKYDVRSREDSEPQETSIRSLMEAHRSLFDGHGYHIDVSHLQSVVRFSTILEDKDFLDKALQMTEYGRHLPRDFQHSDAAPFDDFYNDYRIFLQALLGTGVDGAIRYFTQKADRADVDEQGQHFPGEVLVHLLYRVGRYEESIDAHRKYLTDCRGPLSLVPSLLELSERAGSYTKLLDMAQERDDLLQFAAGLVQQDEGPGED